MKSLWHVIFINNKITGILVVNNTRHYVSTTKYIVIFSHLKLHLDLRSMLHKEAHKNYIVSNTNNLTLVTDDSAPKIAVKNVPTTNHRCANCLTFNISCHKYHHGWKFAVKNVAKSTGRLCLIFPYIKCYLVIYISYVY